MNGNKRSLSASKKSVSAKRTRTELITGPAANTRSKSREKDKENVANNRNFQAKRECDKSGKENRQLGILKQNVRKPLADKNIDTNDRTAKVSQNLNRTNGKTVVIKYSGTCNGPCSSSCQNCSQNNIKRTVNVIQTDNPIDNNQFIARFPRVTLRDSKLQPDELDFKNFKTFSNENLSLQSQENDRFKSLKPNVTHRRESYERNDDFDALLKSEVVVFDSNAISYKRSIFVDNGSPFQERKRCGKVVIYDGIPSLRKKTLKRDVLKASGVKGVVDLDPNLKQEGIILFLYTG